MSAPPTAPGYGRDTLPDLAESLLAALRLPGAADPLGLPAAPRICLLLIDGLGSVPLADAGPDAAPYLASLARTGRTLSAGFPSTTATSLTSLGTALPPGRHGMLGYQLAMPGTGRLLNCLSWDEGVDPARWQPSRTVPQRLTDAGIGAYHVGPRAFADSGLTRAALRGAQYRPAYRLGELAAATLSALRTTDHGLVLAYHPDLDAIGHRYGCGSPAWRYQLRVVDRLVELVAAELPADSALYVTGDHGMVDVTERIDVHTTAELAAGVALLGGEPRARHVYTEPGATADVLAAWRSVLGDRAWVVTRDEAIGAGWFGPLDGALADRIGDVVAVARGTAAVVHSDAEPGATALIGMHGSLEPADRHVPLLAVYGD